MLAGMDVPARCRQTHEARVRHSTISDKQEELVFGLKSFFNFIAGSSRGVYFLQCGTTITPLKLPPIKNELIKFNKGKFTLFILVNLLTKSMILYEELCVCYYTQHRNRQGKKLVILHKSHGIISFKIISFKCETIF